MNNALIDLRGSTEEQAKDGHHSLGAQKTQCLKVAQDLGYKVIETFIDPGRSATNMRRPGLQDMLVRCQDDKTIDAVVRNFEIIGEAANRIDPDFRMKNPEIEWERIRGFRNRIVHDYFGIDYEIVWSIIENDLNGLKTNLESLIVEYQKKT